MGWKNETIIDFFNDYAILFPDIWDRGQILDYNSQPISSCLAWVWTGIHAPGEKGNLAAVYTVGHNLIKVLYS